MEVEVPWVEPEAAWFTPRLTEQAIDWLAWLDLASGLVLPLLSTLVGALVAVLVARHAARTAADIEAERHSRIERTQWYSLMQKASIVASDLAAIVEWIEGSLSRANAAGLTSTRLWQRIGGLSGDSTTVSLDPAEMVPLIEAGEFDLFRQLHEITAQHRVLAASVEYYTKRRSELADRIENSKSAGGSTLVSSLTREQERALEPIMLELDTLAAQIRDRAPRLRTRADKLVEALGPAGHKYFEDPTFKTMKMERFEE